MNQELWAERIRVNRVNSLAEIPMLRISNTTENDGKINAIVKNL